MDELEKYSALSKEPSPAPAPKGPLLPAIPFPWAQLETQ